MVVLMWLIKAMLLFAVVITVIPILIYSHEKFKSNKEKKSSRIMQNKNTIVEKFIYQVNEHISIPYEISHNMKFENGACKVFIEVTCDMKEHGEFYDCLNINIQYTDNEQLDKAIKLNIESLVTKFKESTKVIDYKNELTYKKSKGVI